MTPSRTPSMARSRPRRAGGSRRAWLPWLALLACLAPTSRAAAATDVRVGYVDSGRIFQEYKDAQEAQQRFDRQVQGWRDEAAEKEEVADQLRAEVRDQGPILSALKRQEK